MGEDARRIVTLLTDFGLSDPFVGMMKGVILGINPDAAPVDLCHTGKAYDAAEAAFLLTTAYRYFPRGTIHVAVVDPGVGGPRRPILVACDGHLFVGPDNGLLSPLAERAGSAVRVIAATRYFLHPVSATFHGRDIFSPVAGHLSLGVEPSELGKPIDDYVRLTLPRALQAGSDTVKGRILHVDRFGNLVTNIARADVELLMAGGPTPRLPVHAAGKELPIVAYYGQVAPAAPGAVIGSADYLEIFVNQGNASQCLGIGQGDEVVLCRKDADVSCL